MPDRQQTIREAEAWLNDVALTSTIWADSRSIVLVRDLLALVKEPFVTVVYVEGHEGGVVAAPCCIDDCQYHRVEAAESTVRALREQAESLADRWANARSMSGIAATAKSDCAVELRALLRASPQSQEGKR